MRAITGEIQFVIAITLLILIFTSFVIIFMLIHQRLRMNFQREILKVRLEMLEEAFRTIAQEIHNNICQMLALIRLNLSTYRAEAGNSSDSKIDLSIEQIDKVMEDLRNLSKKLNPEVISQLSLVEALNFHLDFIQKTGLYQTNFEVHGTERSFDPQKKFFVIQIAQEAFNNIIQHAKAESISVLLMYLDDKIILSIKDDGRGFDTSEPVEGTGTLNMRYRATLIGAEFNLQSKLDEGTLVQLILPTA